MGKLFDTLSAKDKEVLAKLSEIGQTSMYALAKETKTPYSTTFNSIKKLENLGFIKEELLLESGRRKILYTLTHSGKTFLSELSSTFEIGMKPSLETRSDPLGDNTIDYLLFQRRETAEIDFKSTLDISEDSDFVNIAKDIFAMSNYGGGFLLIGFRETPTGAFEPNGLPESFHIDQAKLQEKFNSFSNSPLALGYREKPAEDRKRKFAVIYIPPSPTVLKPVKYGSFVNHEGKLRTVFSTDEILFRRGTQSITASEEEIKFIERRSKETEYQIGLLSGMPDRVREKLYANFFEILKMPEVIYSAVLPHNIRFLPYETQGIIYVRRNDEIFSFCDIGKEPFSRYLERGSFKICNVNRFCEDPNMRIILTWLLNSEVKASALKLGLRYDHWNKNTFFYPVESGQTERYESWEGWFKKSKRQVAKRLPIDTLGRSVFVHSSANISFTSICTTFYLRINPEIVLTHDGFETIQGIREGIVKTKLSYNQYNNSFLNLILFWVSRFKLLDKNIINLNDRIHVSSLPVNVNLNVGIRSDRPSGEFTRRNEELYLIENEELP
jgi:DNA-binding MarR family transcriptional regulator